MKKNALMESIRFWSVMFLVIVHFALIAQPVALSQIFAPQPFLPKSEIIPVPNSTLTQTQIMFDHPAYPKAVVYDVVVVEVSDKSSLTKFEAVDSSCATLLQHFEFGKTYNWYYIAYGKSRKVLYKSPSYVFSIQQLPPNKRVRVIVNDESANQGGLISFDYYCMITDRTGTPVWFLPKAPNQEFSQDDKVRDLRISFAGTCTFITQRNAFEIALDGRILWKAPQVGPRSPNYVETLHHGVERLPNGNIMTMGNHTEKFQVPNDTVTVNSEFGVIVEYDRKGNVVWKWDSFTYLRESDLQYKKLNATQWSLSSHLNAFRVTQDGDIIYAGFRDLDRVVMVSKSQGVAGESYGRLTPSGAAPKGDGFFHSQHDVCPLRDGNIAVFNNDSISKDSVVSSIVIFSRAKTGGDAAVVWRFACNFDKLTNGKSEKGGSVDELPNGNLLSNFGTLNRCIEVTRDKKIVWDAFTEYYAADSGIWRPAGQYRSHYVSSLYPCYYSAVIAKQTKKEIWVNITNEGSEQDSYLVNYMGADKKWIFSGESVDVLPGKTLPFLVLSGKIADITTIQVQSVANPDFTRVIKLAK